MIESSREKIINKVISSINDKKEEELTYHQYIHLKKCATGPCGNSKDYDNKMCCAPFIWQIHASDALHITPKHFLCDCTYRDVQIKPVGTISKREPPPDLWWMLFGKLPDYYITKKEAEEKYGWEPGKNLSTLAPGKMIGGDEYYNNKHKLPEKNGRVWYECDIDYNGGRTRNSLRLYYSNDGLMFYSPDHGETQFYWIK